MLSSTSNSHFAYKQSIIPFSRSNYIKNVKNCVRKRQLQKSIAIEIVKYFYNVIVIILLWASNA